MRVDLAGTPKVIGDEELLIRTLDLLFENTVKYAGPGSQLSISSEPGSGRCRLLLDDSGTGVKEGDFQKAFQPFERLDRKHGSVSGAGLGLTLTRAYMTAMGGRIGLARSPLGGLRVWLELPAA